MKQTFVRAITLSSLLITTWVCPAQGLLFTDSFQAGQGDWTFLGGAWIEQQSGGNFIQYDGNRALNTPSPQPDWVSGGYRTFSATVGTEYRWSGHVHNSANNAVADGVYGLAIIHFLGATGDTPIGSAQTTDLTPAQNAWIDFSISGVAPAGTERVRFILNTITPNTVNGGGPLYYDLVQAEITGVPEPTALWALPVILAAAAGRHVFRRRKTS